MANAATTLITHDTPEPVVGRIVVDALADDANGAFDALVIPRIEGRITAIHTNPGAGAAQPQDNWDVTLVDDAGFDVLGGAGLNRDTLNTERAAVSNGFVSRREALTLTLAGNNVNAATARITLFYTWSL